MMYQMLLIAGLQSLFVFSFAVLAYQPYHSVLVGVFDQSTAHWFPM